MSCKHRLLNILLSVMDSYKNKSVVKFPCSKIYLKKQSHHKIRTRKSCKSSGKVSPFHGVLTKNVNEANKKAELLSSKEFDSWREISVSENGKYNITCHHSSSLDSSTVTWAFKLCKSYMKKMYEDSTMGWSDDRKYQEMNDVSARYLIVQEIASSKPVAFSHFRFDMDYEEEVLYCYELHVESEFQRFGIGKLLLKLMEQLAVSYKMKKVILTVFKANLVAISFYKKFGYTFDVTCPVDSENETYDYFILSKYMTEKICR